MEPTAASLKVSKFKEVLKANLKILNRKNQIFGMEPEVEEQLFGEIKKNTKLNEDFKKNKIYFQNKWRAFMIFV